MAGQGSPEEAEQELGILAWRRIDFSQEPALNRSPGRAGNDRY